MPSMNFYSDGSPMPPEAGAQPKEMPFTPYDTNTNAKTQEQFGEDIFQNLFGDDAAPLGGADALFGETPLGNVSEINFFEDAGAVKNENAIFDNFAEPNRPSAKPAQQAEFAAMSFDDEPTRSTAAPMNTPPIKVDALDGYNEVAFFEETKPAPAAPVAIPEPPVVRAPAPEYSAPSAPYVGKRKYKPVFPTDGSTLPPVPFTSVYPVASRVVTPPVEIEHTPTEIPLYNESQDSTYAAHTAAGSFARAQEDMVMADGERLQNQPRRNPDGFENIFDENMFDAAFYGAKNGLKENDSSTNAYDLSAPTSVFAPSSRAAAGELPTAAFNIEDYERARGSATGPQANAPETNNYVAPAEPAPGSFDNMASINPFESSFDTDAFESVSASPQQPMQDEGYNPFMANEWNQDSEELAQTTYPKGDDAYFSEDDDDERPRRTRAPRGGGNGRKGGSNRQILLLVPLIIILVVVIIIVAVKALSGKGESSSSTASVASSYVPITVVPESEVSSVASQPAAPVIPRDEWYMLVANKQNLLTAEATVATTKLANGIEVDSRIVEELNNMLAAAKAASAEMSVNIGYRTYEKQAQLFKTQVATQGGDEAKAATITAPAGASDYNTGLGIALSAQGGTKYDENFASTAQGQWMAAHAAEYGFILRYPQGKEASTGFSHEAWHYRYVGAEQAALINASGLCLEEYLAQGA